MVLIKLSLVLTTMESLAKLLRSELQKSIIKNQSMSEEYIVATKKQALALNKLGFTSGA